MKSAVVNGRWVIFLPNGIADWDAITGDPVARRGWEYCRFESIQKHHHYGDVFYDVGVEHGWITAVLAREFVGAHKMVLIEPSEDFWVNIRKTWQWNNLDQPAAFWPGFISNVTENDEGIRVFDWPESADLSKPECPSMSYRSLTNGSVIPTITIDDLVLRAGGLMPASINIDIEGAELLALQGAANTLMESRLTNVWVSIHPDLMEKNFNHTKTELLDYMLTRGWHGEHLGTDHEEHWWFHR